MQVASARTINLVQAALQCETSAAGQTATEIEVMERGVGEEGTSGQAMEGIRK